jgi:hypothetical protein
VRRAYLNLELLCISYFIRLVFCHPTDPWDFAGISFIISLLTLMKKSSFKRRNLRQPSRVVPENGPNHQLSKMMIRCLVHTSQAVPAECSGTFGSKLEVDIGVTLLAQRRMLSSLTIYTKICRLPRIISELTLPACLVTLPSQMLSLPQRSARLYFMVGKENPCTATTLNLTLCSRFLRDFIRGGHVSSNV